MKILKFGLKYWKKNLILAIIIQLVSYIAIVADLLLPLISELFIDYIITDSHGSTKGVFAFLLNGKYGQPRTFELFYHIALVFGMLLATRLLLIYIKNTSLQRLGLRMET
ncbi:MAG TPA: ABC transporter ATP-binding protein, partial [Clostridiales bacterium]|nr:ABC transporter ATP-binding protein [Clostridiales bacterium]